MRFQLICMIKTLLFLPVDLDDDNDGIPDVDDLDDDNDGILDHGEPKPARTLRRRS